LAPGNQFHQVVATIGYQISPTIRASGEIAFGKMTQNAAYLAQTLNPNLIVPALPAQSLQGRADTLDASVRLSAAVTDRLSVNASLSRDERDNKTPVATYPTVAADAFVGTPRSNQPYSFKQDRFKLSADYRGPWSIKFAAGAEQDHRQRPSQEVGSTREATLWARISAQPIRNVSMALKLAHAERNASEYRALASIDPPENPLLRRYNMADRKRDTAGLRADLTVRENIGVGLHVDIANDDYRHSVIGLTDARSADLGVDVSAAIDDATQLHLFVQGERVRSRQAGSQLFGQPDWTGRTRDCVEMVGLGVKHAPPGGKVELGADLAVSRLRSDVTVDAGVAGPLFPPAKTSIDSVKVYATYRLSNTLSFTGSYWYEHYAAQDWHLAGVLPATVPNLLTLGEQPARYNVNVLRVALRYRF
jgi:MtrB/PioB family decaheme-associated outer membrane protein